MNKIQIKTETGAMYLVKGDEDRQPTTSIFGEECAIVTHTQVRGVAFQEDFTRWEEIFGTLVPVDTVVEYAFIVLEGRPKL